MNIRNGESVIRDIVKNHTHRWTFMNYNLTTVQTEAAHRKLILSLEPCRGVVYLFVRKNIACHPDPYSCINLESGERNLASCERTHFMSTINGSRDGAPTFFQISLTATRYFISVFAAEDAQYTLTVLDDVGAWPRRGNAGTVQAGVVESSKVMLQWHVPTYDPVNISDTKQYYLYVIRLLPNDTETSTAVFLNSDKILNTVCGLSNHSDQPTQIVDADLCDSTCNVTVDGLLNGELYAFNVVAESNRGFKMAYAGVTMVVVWAETEAVDVGGGGGRRLVESTSTVHHAARRLLVDTSSLPTMDNKDMQVMGAVMGSVFGMIGVMGMILLRFST